MKMPQRLNCSVILVTIGMVGSANITQMILMTAPNYDDSTMHALGVFSSAAEGSYSACLSKGDELKIIVT